MRARLMRPDEEGVYKRCSRSHKVVRDGSRTTVGCTNKPAVICHYDFSGDGPTPFCKDCYEKYIRRPGEPSVVDLVVVGESS